MREGQASFTHVKGIVDGLRSLGWKVRVVEPGYRDEPGAYRRLIALGRTQLEALRSLGDCDLVYLRWHWASLPFVAVAKGRGKKLVFEVNGTDDDFLTAWPAARRLSGILVGAARWQLRRADGLVTVTTGLAAWARRISGGKKVAVIPNAADIGLFAPLRDRTSAWPDLGRYVAFVGALAPWQGVDTMLKSAAEPAWPAGVSLVVVGDGARRVACEAASAAGTVRYLGPLPHVQIPELLAHAVASISVQTPTSGRGEVGCSPIKIFEGLAVGRPVIVSDLPGVSDVVTDEGCGLVVPPGDPAALAQAVATLATDDRRASEMGRRARRAAVRDHSWEARARATSRFLEEVLLR
jgi:glycosyltransferase involved in cell wall biosynthesis